VTGSAREVDLDDQVAGIDTGDLRGGALNLGKIAIVSTGFRAFISLQPACKRH
jgi:hypothetical protein